MKTSHLITALCLALVFAGCREPVAPEPEPVPEAASTTGHYSTPMSFAGDEVGPEERAMLAEAGLRATIVISETIEDARGWKDAHAGLLAYLEGESETPDYLREQMAAYRMLQLLLAQEDRSARAMDAIALYAGLLAKHRSPEGALMVQALQTLKGHWSPEEIAAAAGRGVEGVETFLARRYYCDGCASKKRVMDVVVNDEVRTTEEVFLMQAEHALDQLKAMTAL